MFIGLRYFLSSTEKAIVSQPPCEDVNMAGGKLNMDVWASRWVSHDRIEGPGATVNYKQKSIYYPEIDMDARSSIQK